jgi:flagellin-like protein
MLKKRGMSPLIATVLLIAFAVSLAVIIMNLPVTDGGGLPSEGCDAVKIEVQEAFGQEIFCYDNEQIRFIIRNTGEQTIDGLRFRTINEQLSSQEKEVTNSGMRKGESIERAVSYAKTGRIHVELIPRIVIDNEVEYCANKAIVIDALPDC